MVSIQGHKGETMQKKYEELLRQYNIKVTPQRLAIVDALHGRVHMSVDELYETIRKRFPSMSLATVYKNINAMMAEGFILEVKLPGEKSKYELAKEKHAHLLCTKCGKVEDISLNLKPVMEEAVEKSRYQIVGESLLLTGYCPLCRAA